MHYSFLPEDGHCRPKHVAEVSYIYELLSFHCHVVVTNIVYLFTAMIRDDVKFIMTVFSGVLLRGESMD